MVFSIFTLLKVTRPLFAKGQPIIDYGGKKHFYSNGDYETFAWIKAWPGDTWTSIKMKLPFEKYYSNVTTAKGNGWAQTGQVFIEGSIFINAKSVHYTNTELRERL